MTFLLQGAYKLQSTTQTLFYLF